MADVEAEHADCEPRHHCRQLARIEATLDHIVSLLEPHPTRIALGFPAFTRKDGSVANFELANDEVATIPILVDDAAGNPVPPPSGDTFTATATGPSGSTPGGLGAVVTGTNLVLTPTVQVSPGWSVVVSDSAGLTSYTLLVDIVDDLTPKAITLDVAAATETSQPVPTAPGP